MLYADTFQREENIKSNNILFRPISDLTATRISKGLAVGYGIFSYILTFFVQNIPGLVQVTAYIINFVAILFFELLDLNTNIWFQKESCVY